MSLPSAPLQYDQGAENRFRGAVEALDRQNRKIGRDVEAAGAERFILSSPDGTRWALSVADDGTLSAVAA